MASNRNDILIKSAMDKLVSIIILLLFLPICIVVCFLIKLTSKGSVFFLQERPGLYGEIFIIYKFRTMKLGSENMIDGQEVHLDDMRITKVGKILRRTKLDELPQLINVLKGEMSLVGPRPERVTSLAKYDDMTKRRLNMRPGITGLAQVSGNIYLKLKDRYVLDVFYVDNYNLILDLKILLRTIGVVVFGEEKYKNKMLIDVNFD